jgi:4-amino-4-deoxy-L-arabinose transferase-like glycosyltransferase
MSARTAEQPASRAAGLVRLLVPPLVAVLVLALFLDKAFTIDDPLFLWLAHHVRAHPLDFFGFDVIWTGTWEPMHEVTKNPPLTGYFIALAALLVGWSEVGLHAAFLVPAALAAAGIHALARRLAPRPLEAALIAILSPAFLVSSTNVMSDTSMLALFAWALWLWLRGVDEGRARDLVLAGLLAGLAALTKYFALALVPLFVAYGLLKRRRLGGWALGALPALLIVAAFELAAHRLYGHGLVLSAADYATEFRGKESAGALERAVVGLVFAGGSSVAALVYAPWLWSKRALGLAAALGALALALHRSWFPAAGILLETSIEMTFATALQIVLLALGGVSLVALAFAELARRRDAESWLLCLWVLGTFVFAAFVNWVNNGRSNLPMAPAVAILIARRLDARGAGRGPLLAGLAPAALIALLVTYADYAWANLVRSDARDLVAKYAGRTEALKFLGTWGFEYYMEQGGAVPVDGRKAVFQPGELLVIPTNNNKIDLKGVGEPYAELLANPRHARPFPLWTMSWENWAGFYASNYGPLPYAFGREVSDYYQIWRVKDAFQVKALEGR